MDAQTIESKLQFLGELLSVNTACHLWTYDKEGILSWTNSSELSLNNIFCHQEAFQFMKKHFGEQGNTNPLLMSSPSGLIWGASAEMDAAGKVQAYHVAGPIFTQTKSESSLRKEINAATFSPQYTEKYVKLLSSLPVVSMNAFFSVLLMLHYTVTGEKLSNVSITMQIGADDEEKNNAGIGEADNNQNDRLRVYMAEQILLNMIKDGHIDKAQFTQAGGTFTGTQTYSENPIQHAKLSRALFAGQAAKAAIEGGVSTDIAYTRQDLYMQDLEKAKSLSEISQLSMTMFNDWVELVHKAKKESKYSKPVQSCCDYINTHVNEMVTINILAEKMGYADYYLSRKFRSEVGIGIDDYIKDAKIERAKVLLSSSHMSIHEISDHLAFGTRNYFAEVFRKKTGTSPFQYRKENQHF